MARLNDLKMRVSELERIIALGSQIVDNENNFLNASLKVISRNQQWSTPEISFK